MNDETQWKLDADPKRQAPDALRGYLYQAWQALHAWLDLKDEQVLYLEGAEDFDVIDDSSGKPVQVKDTSANITLRTQSVTDAICHYWKLSKAHFDKSIEFKYLTRASITCEKSSPFGKNRSGLSLWQECHGDVEIVAALAKFLCEDAAIKPRLPVDLIKFLSESAPHDVHARMIKPMMWLTDSPPITSVVKAIERKLINHGDKLPRPVLPSECIKVIDRLLREVLTVSSRKNYEERKLFFADFALLFEEATHRSVPINEYNQIQAIQRGMAGLMSSNDVNSSLQLVGVVSSEILIPPLPPNIAPRKNILEQCKSKLAVNHCLYISASTGMGKSTLAKLIAISIGSDWAWFSFSSLSDSKQYIFALKMVARRIDELPHGTNIILDDVDFEPASVIEWESIYSGLIYTARSRQIKIISTSRKPVPARLCLALGITKEAEFFVPDFDLEEIRDFCLWLGCPKGKKLESHIHVAYAQTLGHPQLIHARLLTLSRQGWPDVYVESLLETPEDIKEQLSQSRQLLNILSSDEKDLLYRCSVATGSFLREHIVAIGEKANLKHPGDLFDHLVGPWIKRTSNDRYELSQLLKNAASEVWSQSTLESIHFQMANAILKGTNLSIEDGANVLFHAFVGKNEYAFLMLGKSLTCDASEEVKKAIAEKSLWFVCSGLEVKNGLLYPSNPIINPMFRMIQFNLCVTAFPETAVKILNTWEQEVNRLDNADLNLLSKLLFFINAILYAQVQLPFKRVLDLFKSLVNIRENLIRLNKSELLAQCSLLKIDRNGEPVNVLAILFGINSLRCKTKTDLSELLVELSQLNSELRNELLGAFNLPEGYASAFVNSAYLSEGKTENPDWQSCLSVFNKTMDYAIEWDAPGLGAAAARAASIVMDEELHCSDKALVIIDKGGELFPSHLQLLNEQRGTILLQAKRYEEAVSVFTAALDGREDGCRELLYNPLFSFRNAGIAAANAHLWEVSAEFFLRGSRCAEKMEDSVLMAAFLTDASYAFWNAKLLKKMLVAIRSSLGLIDKTKRDKTDLGVFWVYRVTAHTLSWLRSFIEDGHPRTELTTPTPGLCSNPFRNEEILTLPDVPFEITLYFLVRLEMALQEPVDSLEKYGERLDKCPLPVIVMFMSDLRIERSFNNCMFGDMPALVDKFTRGLLESKAASSRGEHAWSLTEVLVTDEQIRASIFEKDLLKGSLFAALLQTYFSLTTASCIEQIQEWKEFTRELSWYDDLVKFLENAEYFFQMSNCDLKTKLHDNRASARDRLWAAMLLAKDPENSELCTLLQAHIFLLDSFSQSCVWGKCIEKTLSRTITSVWQKRSRERFALCMPQLNVPPLVEACSVLEESFGKVASVIVCASRAAGINLPSDLVDRYRLLLRQEQGAQS